MIHYSFFYIIHDHIDASFVFLLPKDFYITHKHIGPFYLFCSSKIFCYLSQAFFESFFFVFFDNILLTLLYTENNYKKQYIMELPSALSAPSSQDFSLRKISYTFFLKRPLWKFFLLFRKIELKNFFILQKMELSYIFLKESFSYISGNRNPQRKFLIFQEMEALENFLYLWKNIFLYFFL